MEYCSVIERNELLTHSTTQMNIKTIMLKKATEDYIHHIIPFMKF